MHDNKAGRAAHAQPVTYRQLGPDELRRVGEIDRTERIDSIYRQRGVELDPVSGEFSASPWSLEGSGAHSVAHQIEECERHVAAGGLALGAFAAGRLIGIGIVVPHFRAAVAQLAVLYVTDEFRGCGVGRELHNLLEREARQLGATQIVVSATPSKNTVDFYLRRGFTPTASPIRELYDLEPEDVHMEKGL